VRARRAHPAEAQESAQRELVGIDPQLRLGGLMGNGFKRSAADR
jgi:hypothetical protein